MSSFISRLKRSIIHTQNGHAPPPPLDLDAEVGRVRQAEASGVIPTGHLIHRFTYTGLDLRLDRDMTGTYRLTVNEGGHRLYSFSVICARNDYLALLKAYEEITRFLAGSRAPADLPRRDGLMGHYYGSGADPVGSEG
ncbi:MAG TPA: hypothetical protein VFG50_12490 [Rhodothermales bacterium]|nr:hypothetical protein [Rhodothermales bacterium]